MKSSEENIKIDFQTCVFEPSKTGSNFWKMYLLKLSKNNSDPEKCKKVCTAFDLIIYIIKNNVPEMSRVYYLY